MEIVNATGVTEANETVKERSHMDVPRQGQNARTIYSYTDFQLRICIERIADGWMDLGPYPVILPDDTEDSGRHPHHEGTSRRHLQRTRGAHGHATRQR